MRDWLSIEAACNVIAMANHGPLQRQAAEAAAEDLVELLKGDEVAEEAEPAEGEDDVERDMRRKV